MTTDTTQGPALQDAWPDATCYGCGPANSAGLHIKSYWDADGTTVIAHYRAGVQYNAGFANVLYGGLVASLIDCHANWTAIATAYRAAGRPHGSRPVISYVTGSLSVRFLAPTPLDAELLLCARVTEVQGRKATVTCTVQAGDRVTAEATVLAVRIAEDKSVGVAEARI